MIERYSLPEMKRIWEEENKFRIMRDIEVLVCEALRRQKKIPASSYQHIKNKARFNLNTIKKLEAKTQHDVVAFITNLAQNLGKDAQYLHLGLTSSDLLDTTLSIQLKQATTILIRDLSNLLKILARQAKRYKGVSSSGKSHTILTNSNGGIWMNIPTKAVSSVMNYQKPYSGRMMPMTEIVFKDWVLNLGELGVSIQVGIDRLKNDPINEVHT